jgi:hypothetical protein
MTTPLSTILDRDEPVQNVRDHFCDQLEVMRDVVNYGSNLIPRCFESSPKGVADVVVIVALLKQLVAMLDGVELHVSNAAVLASYVSLRALYETHLYVSWVLRSDTDTRARHYYVWSLRQRRKWDSRVIPGTKEHANFQHALQHLPIFQSASPNDQQRVEQFQHEATQDVAQIDQLLNSPSYKAINDGFDNYWNRPYDPPWHAPCGVQSIRALAEKLGLLHEYEVLYSSLSSVTHSSCFKQHVAVQGNSIVFEPIRYLESIDFVLNLAFSTSFRVYRQVLQFYRPGEVENFNRKYIEEWREAFTTIRRVSYTQKLQQQP